MAQSTSTIDQRGKRCTVSRGRWLAPYTGKFFFEASDVDIDHLVPLKWAWDQGAKEPPKWMPPRESFRGCLWSYVGVRAFLVSPVSSRIVSFSLSSSLGFASHHDALEVYKDQLTASAFGLLGAAG